MSDRNLRDIAILIENFEVTEISETIYTFTYNNKFYIYIFQKEYYKLPLIMCINLGDHQIISPWHIKNIDKFKKIALLSSYSILDQIEFVDKYDSRCTINQLLDNFKNMITEISNSFDYYNESGLRLEEIDNQDHGYIENILNLNNCYQYLKMIKTMNQIVFSKNYSDFIRNFELELESIKGRIEFHRELIV